MEFSFEETILSHLHLAAEEWLRQEETLDMIVPDSVPDAQQILDCYGVASVRSVECRTGSVLISGGIQAGVIYLAQDEAAPRVMESYLPFTIKKEIEGCTEEAQTVVQCRITQAQGRILNSRKLMLRMEVGCILQVYLPRQQSVYQPDKSDQNLQLLCREETLTLPVEATQKHFSFQEEVELPAGRAPVGKLLRYDVQPAVLERRLAGNRAVFKGEVTLEAVYLTQDNAVEHWVTQLPFSQYLDLMGNYDEEDLNLTLQWAGCAVVWEEDRLCLDGMLLVQAVILAPKTLTLVEDAYYLGGDIQCRTTQSTFRCSKSQQQSIPLRFTIPGQLSRVLDGQTWLGRPEISHKAGSVTLRAPVNVSLWGQGENGQLASVQGQGWAEWNNPPEELRGVTGTVVGEVYTTPGPDGMEVRLTVALQGDEQSLRQYQSICGASVQAQLRSEERPSVLIRRLDRETPLWELAKSCGTTRSRIQQANALSGDLIGAGALVLIPLE